MRRPFAAAAFALALLLAAAGSGGAAAPNPSVVAQPITAVVLADESGSLTAVGVAAERDAAAALVSSDLSPDSRFMIVGFGSNNGQLGQSAVADYCDFITVKTRNDRDALSRCAQKIHVRTAAQGNDTDHATALQHAIDELRSAGGTDQVIFLLTDGVLDVHNSPAFGATPTRRTEEAKRRIREQFLPEARREGIQIWPLGFGPGAFKPALDTFAAGGAGANRLCVGVAGARPHALLVHSDADVIHSLVEALGRSRCGQVGDPVIGTLASGDTRTLKVVIPPIATDGAIVVTKRAPSLQVSFVDPHGNTAPESGRFQGQTFQLSGKDSRVEALQIGNPLPGTWKVRVADPQHVANGNLISAFAVWQGSLQASLILNPALPKPGDAVHLELRVLSRNGIVSEQALRSANAAAAASYASGKAVPVPVQLADDGHGVFRGSFALPSDIKGEVTVTARVSGLGLAADQRIVNFNVQTANILSPTFNLELPHVVHPGDTINGTVSLLNQGTEKTATIELAGLPPKLQVALVEPVGPQKVPVGQSEIPFTLKVAKTNNNGPLYGQVRLVSNGQVYGQAYLAATVAKRLSWWESNRAWLFPVALVLLLAAAVALVYALVLRGRRRLEREGIHSLQLTLKSPGSTSTLDADESSRKALEFHFRLVESEPPRLGPADDPAGVPAVLRRNEMALLMTINGETYEGTVGQPFELGPNRTLTVIRRQASVFGDDGGGAPAGEDGLDGPYGLTRPDGPAVPRSLERYEN